jgi:hypothetical protein
MSKDFIAGQTAPSLPTKTINCYRSGVPIAQVTALCSQGWPMLNEFQQVMIHPIYGMNLAKLILKAKEHYTKGEDNAWLGVNHHANELRLCMSAIMYALDCIWQAPQDSKHHLPSLPSFAVAVGSCTRLLNLAAWYHFGTSKRLLFPQYRVSLFNENPNWENFSGWLDTADTIREEWEAGRAENVRQDEVRKRNEALLTVRADSVYKRIDLNKVWAWIEIQMAGNKSYPAGRRETFKNLFMKGDTNPEDWSSDDIDDLVEAILVTCDVGNEIMHFVQTRLRHIREIVVDFYSSFTIIGRVTAEGNTAHPDLSPLEQAKQEQLFGEYDRKVASLSELPPPPNRADYASLALFLRAQAQHNILVRRFNLQKGQ